MNIFHASAAACLLSFAAPALAQQDTAIPDDPNSLTIGVGVGVAPTYEGSDNYYLTPTAIAYGKVANFAFYTRGTTGYFDLIREPSGTAVDFALGPAANLRTDRAQRIKDARVRALGELDTAIELGGFVGVGKTGILHAYDNLSARVSYVRDVTDTHDSYVLQPAIEYGTPLSRKTYVGFQLSADYAGEKFADTYYSVDVPGAARSGLAVYDADDGWKSVRFSLLGTGSLTGDLTSHGLKIFAVASYASMLGDFKRSPLVRQAGDADQWFGTIGLAYSF